MSMAAVSMGWIAARDVWAKRLTSTFDTVGVTVIPTVLIKLIAEYVTERRASTRLIGCLSVRFADCYVEWCGVLCCVFRL